MEEDCICDDCGTVMDLEEAYLYDAMCLCGDCWMTYMDDDDEE